MKYAGRSLLVKNLLLNDKGEPQRPLLTANPGRF